MQEKWLFVRGFAKRYQISNFGRLKSFYGNRERILKPVKHCMGYVGYQLAAKNKITYYYAHRLVAKYFICNPHKKKIVNHKNAKKKDNRVCNLEWATASENMKHAIRMKKK